jgi:two-component sensor histidine kinase
MEQVEVIFDIDSININANSAIYLGMITSELVSNSVKYAFEGILEPLITISMKRGADNEQLFLIIKDNGIGQSLQEPKQNGMGLRLVDIFSRQLQGTYDIDKKNGFDYRLSFQLKDS